jgi:hypothetical protein
MSTEVNERYEDIVARIESHFNQIPPNVLYQKILKCLKEGSISMIIINGVKYTPNHVRTYNGERQFREMFLSEGL